MTFKRYFALTLATMSLVPLEKTGLTENKLCTFALVLKGGAYMYRKEVCWGIKKRRKDTSILIPEWSGYSVRGFKKVTN